MTEKTEIILARENIPVNSIEITVPISLVTITEDQADIYRESPVKWEKGPLNILIKDVSPYLIDKTLWSEVVVKNKGNSKPEIGSTRCIRWFITPDKTSKEKKIIDAIENLCKKLDNIYYKKDRINRSQVTGSSVFKPAVERILESILIFGVMPGFYNNQFDIILEDIQSYYRESYELLKRERDCQRKLREIQKEIFLDKPLLFKKAGILISMEANSPGEGIIKCGYQVPCAQWRPQHESHLLSEDKVLLVTHGVIWQNTGEDWENVKLILSTSKPSLGMEVTLPEEDLLRLRKKTPLEKKRIQVETRDEVITKTGASEEPGEPPLPSDGGETQFYRIKEPVKISANGRPHIIPLGELSLKAETSLTGIPEIDTKIYLQSLVKNTQNRPILAGPLSLHRKGSFIGHGEIEFIGSNSSFYLWWGSEDLLKVERYVDKKDEKGGLLSNRRVIYTITLHIRNISGDEATVKLQERIPVSEIEQIKTTVKEKDLPGRQNPIKTVLSLFLLP